MPLLSGFAIEDHIDRGNGHVNLLTVAEDRLQSIGQLLVYHVSSRIAIKNTY